MRNLRLITTIISAAAIITLVIWASVQPSSWRPIASYETSLDGRTDAQVHNLQIALKSINGKILAPGGEFSFNRTVGSWTAQRGYVKAPVSFDGELIPAWGGGVCQASSTLYNAALLAGLNILERHHHRFSAKYVPPGQDAAVAQYDIDLRIQNPYKWPIKVCAEIVGNHAACRILSQHPIGRQISIEREISQITAPSEVIRTTCSAHNRMKIVNHGQPGMRVLVYRRISEGTKSTKVLISENTYPPMNKLIKAE